MNLIEYVDGARIVTPERLLEPPAVPSDLEEQQDDDVYELASTLLKLNAHRLPERADDIHTCLDVLTDLLATDMAPVRYGRWVVPHGNATPYCSSCKSPAERTYFGGYSCSDFCPSCGAKMNSKRRLDHVRAI